MVSPVKTPSDLATKYAKCLGTVDIAKSTNRCASSVDEELTYSQMVFSTSENSNYRMIAANRLTEIAQAMPVAAREARFSAIVPEVGRYLNSSEALSNGGSFYSYDELHAHATLLGTIASSSALATLGAAAARCVIGGAGEGSFDRNRRHAAVEALHLSIKEGYVGENGFEAMRLLMEVATRNGCYLSQKQAARAVAEIVADAAE